MNEDERKAIELIGGMVKLTSDYVEDRVIGPREVKALCIILDLIKKQQKVIDEMASYLSIIRACPNEDCGANIDCERRCNLTDELQKECWKIYFNRRVEWGD